MRVNLDRPQISNILSILSQDIELCSRRIYVKSGYVTYNTTQLCIESMLDTFCVVLL